MLNINGRADNKLFIKIQNFLTNCEYIIFDAGRVYVVIHIDSIG